MSKLRDALIDWLTIGPPYPLPGIFAPIGVGCPNEDEALLAEEITNILGGKGKTNDLLARAILSALTAPDDETAFVLFKSYPLARVIYSRVASVKEFATLILDRPGERFRYPRLELLSHVSVGRTQARYGTLFYDHSIYDVRDISFVDLAHYEVALRGRTLANRNAKKRAR